MTDTLETAITNAAEALPDRSAIEIEIKRGQVSVRLVNQNGCEYQDPTNLTDAVDHSVLQALDIVAKNTSAQSQQ